MTHTIILALLVIAVTVGLAGTVQAQPLGTPDPATIEWPNGEPSPALVELGKTLFFDPRLVPNEQQSCASCHAPQMGFADGRALDLNGHKEWSIAKRNSPMINNLAWAQVIHWDGRTPSGTCFTAEDTGEAFCPPALEAQAFKSMKKRKVYAHFIPRVQAIPAYRELFRRAFPPDGAITHANMARAIGAFERGLVSYDSPFDRYLAGDENALTMEARRGLDVFQGRGRCIVCHGGINLTDGGFHNIGLAGDDPGRAAVLEKAGDAEHARYLSAFKTPGLRNVALTAPYMHDGRLGSLEEVVAFYDQGGGTHPNKSSLIQALGLSEREQWDLVAFLYALTDPIEIDLPVIPD